MYQESAERVGEENGKGGGDASECHCELATPGRQAGAGETTARVAECNGMAISTALTCACLRSRGPEREGGRGFLWLCHCLVVCATAVGDRSPEKRRSRFDFRPAFAIMSGSPPSPVEPQLHQDRGHTDGTCGAPASAPSTGLFSAVYQRAIQGSWEPISGGHAAVQASRCFRSS